VRPGEQIIAALELRLADENPAVGLRRGAKFELENKTFRKIARSRELLNLPSLRRRGHDEPPVFRDITAIAARGLTVKLDRLRHNRPRGRAGRVALLPVLCRLDVRRRGRAIPPAGQVVAVE